jgi:Na+-transporting NADH:ubiquinone oxidoreductase subunit B
MKPLRDLLDRLKPRFEKNKYLHTTFDAIETFLFKPNHITNDGVHVRDGMDLKRTMFHVVIGLQLAYLFGSYNMGHQHYISLAGTAEAAAGIFDMWGQKLLYGLLQLLPLFIVVHVVGLAIEFIFAAVKGHSVEEGFLVSGALLPLIMPPDIPLWMVALATAFAVIIAKEAFGGTGMNILNVALTARVFIFFAYPTDISGDVAWVAYDYNFLHSLVNSFTPDFLMISSGTNIVDGFSGATPLALAAKGGWEAVTAQYSVSDMIWGFIPGSIGEMSKIAVIMGAVILIITGIGSWRIMLSMVAGAFAMALLFNGLAPVFPDYAFLTVPPPGHFLMGGFFFAMAFMATDPVTAAQTETGKWIYGFMIGMIGMLVRVSNPAYPEGWMMAILLMNVFAPLIDHYVLEAHMNKRLRRV